MEKKTYQVLGVMSGTSLDGIDLAWVAFKLENNQWKMQIKKAETFEYLDKWRIKLEKAATLKTTEIEELDQHYTNYLASVIGGFIRQNKISSLDAVCSHGHTVLHQPEQKLTWQIGNLPSLAENLQEKVVCDFRTQDVALGGQGAPLVPIGDKLLFREYDYCLNLGGFANISTQINQERIAYDITAVNTVLNYLMKTEGRAFDAGGKLAATGKINTKLLNKLNALPFYKQQAPKSLGIEWVNAVVLPILNATTATTANKLATYAEHIAVQIAKELSINKKSSCLVTGGGAFNSHLIESIAQKTNTKLILLNKELVDFKEAVVFALLGVLRLRNENNVLKSVTGASRDHVAGKVYSY